MSDPSAASIISTPPAHAPDEIGAPTNAGLPENARKEKPRGLLGDAWRDLRRRPLFWISASLIALFMLMTAFPSLFTSATRRTARCRAPRQPSSDAWFGYDLQGRDVFARVIYGARASIVVSLLSMPACCCSAARWA